MDKKYLKNIELDKIVEMAARHAVCPEAALRLREEAPLERAEDVRWLLRQTDEAARLLLKNGHPRLSACPEADLAVSRAAKGGVLSMAELLNVSWALRNFSALAGWFDAKDGQEKAAALEDLFYAITPQPALERDIAEAILSESEMADTASDELYAIRRKIRAAEGSIREKLDAVVKNPANARALQEALVSIRNGRFVVPVRAEHRGEIAGVIHDVSSSGGTLFVEPAAVVEANAKILQLRSAEQAETERILWDFSQRVAGISPLFEAAWDAMLEVDKRLAKAQLGLSMDAVCPEVDDGQSFSLAGARHPLLARGTVVPVDISLGGEYDTMIITGPNTGGKTVSLKTAGLLSAMAQTGYLIPARDTSRVCVFDEILVDIGDEQSIEQSLSTFSGHIKNITEILKTAGGRSLVLLDELGAGTDPAEGAALAVAIIERLRGTRALVMATTHYAELKMFAIETEGVQNAGSEFSVETLRPTYRLIVGVPGRSNAFLIGEKLGVPADVIERARAHLSAEQRRFETVLAELEDMKLAARRQEEEIERLRNIAAHSLRDAKAQCDALIRRGEEELAAARRRAKALADEVQSAAFGLLDEVKRMEKEQRLSNAQKARRARQIAGGEAAALASRAGADTDELPAAFVPLQKAEAGQEVWVPSLGKRGTAASADKNGFVELRVGALKMKFKLSELCAPPRRGEKTAAPRGVAAVKSGEAAVRTPHTELNLLGRTVEEAVMETESFIDGALMSGLSTVYVIHGRGTGALRRAVDMCLRQNKSVKSHRLGRYGEGEDGVTVVELQP